MLKIDLIGEFLFMVIIHKELKYKLDYRSNTVPLMLSEVKGRVVERRRGYIKATSSIL